MSKVRADGIDRVVVDIAAISALGSQRADFTQAINAKAWHGL